MIHEGDNVKLTGKVTESKYGTYLANPEFEKTPNMPIDSHDTLFTKKSADNTGYSFPHLPRNQRYNFQMVLSCQF